MNKPVFQRIDRLLASVYLSGCLFGLHFICHINHECLVLRCGDALAMGLIKRVACLWHLGSGRRQKMSDYHWKNLLNEKLKFWSKRKINLGLRKKNASHCYEYLNIYFFNFKWALLSQTGTILVVGYFFPMMQSSPVKPQIVSSQNVKELEQVLFSLQLKSSKEQCTR